jgi:hypothetical protein
MAFFQLKSSQSVKSGGKMIMNINNVELSYCDLF